MHSKRKLILKGRMNDANKEPIENKENAVADKPYTDAKASDQAKALEVVTNK